MTEPDATCPPAAPGDTPYPPCEICGKCDMTKFVEGTNRIEGDIVYQTVSGRWMHASCWVKLMRPELLEGESEDQEVSRVR